MNANIAEIHPFRWKVLLHAVLTYLAMNHLSIGLPGVAPRQREYRGRDRLAS